MYKYVYNSKKTKKVTNPGFMSRDLSFKSLYKCLDKNVKEIYIYHYNKLKKEEAYE